MRSLLVAVALAAVSCCAFAGDVVGRLNRLVSEGNVAYELSQPSKIKLYADSIAAILGSGSVEGEALEDFRVSMLKLYGNWHYESERFDSAESCYAKAIGIMDANPLADFHGSRMLMPREMAQLHYRKGEYQKALEDMEAPVDFLEWNDVYDRGDDNRLITMMTYAMCLARVGRCAEALEIAEAEMKGAKDRSTLNYAKAQRMYAKIMLLSEAGRDGAAQAYRGYFSRQKEDALARLTRMTGKERTELWHTLQPFVRDCCLLEDEDPGLLYDVALFSKGLLMRLGSDSGDTLPSARDVASLQATWRDVQKKLKDDDAAIEFIQYGEGDSRRMGALVLRRRGEPEFVPVASPQDVVAMAGKALNTTWRKDKNRLYGDTLLQAAVWTPRLLGRLDGVRRVFFAPDGYLHRIAVEYMPQVAHLSVCRLTSTRRLVEQAESYDDSRPLLALGAIDYDCGKTESASGKNDPQAFVNYVGKYFPNLGEETDETREIMELRANPRDLKLSGSVASEAEFRSRAGEFSSIILSSHGDFSARSPVATDLKPVTGDDTMSRHVIAFAGINTNLRDYEFDSASNFDGLLSAAELSTMDLGACGLFIASTCQSALGEISADGVVGLQRGLKNAGVGAMLVSLWDVDSEATCMLMKEFHRQLHLGLPVREAFAKARGSLLRDDVQAEETYEFNPATMAAERVATQSRSFATPQFAAAFILIDALD